jgi:adenylate cyclase
MTQEGFKRKLTSIFSTDAVGYSRLMGEDEAATVHTITIYRNVISALIKQHNGTVIDSPGDNLLAEFASVVDAVQCAVAVQKELKARNDELPENRKMQFRIGINLGDVIQEGDRIYGDGVNIAARLEGLAEPGGVCISGLVYDQVENKVPFEYEDMGKQTVKNITKPIHVYRVLAISDINSPDLGIEFELPDKPSIAVLPFVNMSGDSEQEYFSDGITEDIITALSRSPWLFVISRNSSFAYRGVMVDVKQISKELGVRYILEGSVRKAGNRVRVTAQLIDGNIGNHVWAEKYDGELHDIFDLQDGITQQVVATLLTQIQTHVGEITKRFEHPDVVTWDLLARGWKLYYEMTKESLVAAEKIFRRAIALSPSSCDPHHLLAGVLFHQVWMGYVTDNGAIISEAYELAILAIGINERNEYAHWTFGLIQLARGKHDMAIAELKRAIELNPNCSLAYGSLGTVLSFSGEFDESIKNNEIAIRSNPLDPSIFYRYSGIAMAHFLAGRHSEAVQWAIKSIHRKPTWRLGHAVLVSALAQQNRLEEAKVAVDNFLGIIPDATISDFRKLPFKNQDDAQQIGDGLRNAGLPE